MAFGPASHPSFQFLIAYLDRLLRPCPIYSIDS
jgi:hypothetical protein